MYFKLLLPLLSLLPSPAIAQTPSFSPEPTYYDPTGSPYPSPSPSNFPTGASPSTDQPTDAPSAPTAVTSVPTVSLPTESPQPSPAPSVAGNGGSSATGVCEVCGPGSRVTSPDAIFSRPGEPDVTCDEIEKAGLNAFLPKDTCDSLPSQLTMCGCTAVPTAAPTFTCNICTGSSRGGQSVSQPDTMVTLPGQTPTRCGDLEIGGLSGTISETDCPSLPSMIDVCVCDLDGSPTVMPSLSPSIMPVTPSIPTGAPFALLPPNVGPDINFVVSSTPSLAPVVAPTDETPDPTPPPTFVAPVSSPVMPPVVAPVGAPIVVPMAAPVSPPVFEPPGNDDNVQIQGPPATSANLSGGAIFGILLASVVGTGLLLLGFYWIYRELAIRSTHTTGEVVVSSPTSNNKGPPQTMFENMAPQVSSVEGADTVGGVPEGGADGVVPEGGADGGADGKESSINEVGIL